MSTGSEIGRSGPPKRPNKILHIVNDLAIGGTEMMLYKLLSRMNRERFESTVVSLDGQGKVCSLIRQLAIKVYPLGMKSFPLPLTLSRLARLVRLVRPDLIQGWMYHGNLAAQFAGLFAPRPCVVLWNIRQSVPNLKYEKKGTAQAIRWSARLSAWPSGILNNSQNSVAQHASLGFDTRATVVIPNGFDTELFVPSEEARFRVRAELGVPSDSILIGRIGRYHPTKDHPSLLRAAAMLLRDYPNTQFVLAGKDVDWNNDELRSLVLKLGLAERVHLLGERFDIPSLTAALDIATSSSKAEGFSNVIGEAMSCEVMCVVTDVGDCRSLVGGTGWVIPPEDAASLAAAWKSSIELGPEGRHYLGMAARARVINQYSLDSVVAQYQSCYQQILCEGIGAKMGSRVESSFVGSATVRISR